MESFIVEDSEFTRSQNAFGSSNHITHCLAVILVCYFVVDGNAIFCVNSGLYIINYLVICCVALSAGFQDQIWRSELLLIL